MSKKFIVWASDECSAEDLNSILYLGTKSDEAPGKLLQITARVSSEVTNPEGRMTFEQREKLWHLCQGYNVPFREDDYHKSPIGYGSYSGESPSYEGWIGGKDKARQTIYVMVEPDGRSHT